MKREVEREKELPAFVLNVGELQLLWARMLDLFEDKEGVYSTLDISLPREQLEFKNAEEFAAYDQLPSRVTTFSLRLSHEGKRVVLRSGRLLASRAHVSASSPTEAWCAGAIDTVNSFVQTRKVWYSWFTSAPIGWLLFILGNAPVVSSMLLPKETQISKLVAFGWIGVFLALLSLYFGREKLLPAASIRIDEKQGFIRAHVAELSLAIAALSAILTVAGWFVSK